MNYDRFSGVVVLKVRGGPCWYGTEEESFKVQVLIFIHYKMTLLGFGGFSFVF